MHHYFACSEKNDDNYLNHYMSEVPHSITALWREHVRLSFRNR
eukprot:COSAG02_NODE_62401_length_266_cov_0.604790_1_plen_42_part_01